MRLARGSFNTNTVIAVAALVTSVVAVLVSWQEARLLRQNQEAAFLPIVEVRKGFDTSADQLSLDLTVRNSGQGVAIVRGGQLRFAGEPIVGYEAFGRDVLTPVLASRAAFNFYSAKGYYSPGEAKPVLSLTWEDEPALRKAFETYVETKALSAGQSLTLELCYCSVFDRCWVTDGEREPEPVGRCDTNEGPIDRLYASYVEGRTQAEEAGDER